MPRVAVKLRVARFLQAFLAMMLPAAKVVRGVCACDAICRQRLTAMPLDRSHEASWSFKSESPSGIRRRESGIREIPDHLKPDC